MGKLVKIFKTVVKGGAQSNCFHLPSRESRAGIQSNYLEIRQNIATNFRDKYWLASTTKDKASAAIHVNGMPEGLIFTTPPPEPASMLKASPSPCLKRVWHDPSPNIVAMPDQSFLVLLRGQRLEVPLEPPLCNFGIRAGCPESSNGASPVEFLFVLCFFHKDFSKTFFQMMI